MLFLYLGILRGGVMSSRMNWSFHCSLYLPVAFTCPP